MEEGRSIHDDSSQSSLIKAKALSYSSMPGCNSALQGWSDRTAEDLSDDTYVAVHNFYLIDIFPHGLRGNLFPA